MILSVVGTRPNFVKLGPVARALRARNLSHRIVHTGQHYDVALSESFFRDLEIPPPDRHLGVGSGTHATQVAGILRALETVLHEERPAIVLVYGDVNSTLAAGLAAAQAGIPLAHVEAGLRSRDRTMPEETNRIAVDHLADLHFATTEASAANLRAEGIATEGIHTVGNTLLDALVWALPLARLRSVAALGISPGENYAVATIHRPANTDDPEALERTLACLRAVAEEIPTIFPVHPRTRAALARSGGLERVSPSLRLVDPLGYIDFLSLLASSRLVVTDSGGIQDETSHLGIPCLTVRPNTERPETLGATNRLVPAEPEILRAAAREALARPVEAWRALRREEDGRAAERIAEILKTTGGPSRR